jgi:4-carboxymuconolactone decarboxylase
MSDRMPPLPIAGLTPEQLRAAEEFESTRGTPVFGPFVPLLRRPTTMLRVAALGEHLRFRSSLPQRLTELIVLTVARAWSQQVEWRIHEPLARQAGLDDQVIEALAAGLRPEFSRQDEAMVFALLQELQQTTQVSDGTYDDAVRALGEHGVIDAVVTAGYYTLLAMVMNTAQTTPPAAV